MGEKDPIFNDQALNGMIPTNLLKELSFLHI
jgi:hypothetical protein